MCTHARLRHGRVCAQAANPQVVPCISVQPGTARDRVYMRPGALPRTLPCGPGLDGLAYARAGQIYIDTLFETLKLQYQWTVESGRDALID